MAASSVVAARWAASLAAHAILPAPDYRSTSSTRRRTARSRTAPRSTTRTCKLDSQGYRIDKNGERIGMVDMPAKTAGESSNAVAGYYISTHRRSARRASVDGAERRRAAAGAGYGPGSATARRTRTCRRPGRRHVDAVRRRNRADARARSRPK